MEQISQDIKDLVIARIQTLPDDMAISVGSDGEFSKEDLIQRVQEGDEIGRKMVAVEMDFLRSLKQGVFYDQ